MTSATQSQTGTSVDPVTLEVIRHAFLAAADEMKLNLMRTAYNPIIYEVLDFSVGVFDARCRTVAQADGLPIFLGNLGIAVQCVVDDIGVDNLRPGDLYLFNDPYAQGNHVNDLTTIVPVFDAEGPIAFASTRAHWLDIGGKDPGGSIDSTDVVQEGLWFRSIPLYREGVLNDAVWRIIEYNVRYTKNMLGDLRAQVAASRTGEQRLAGIFARHGRAVTEAAIEEINRQGEQRVRAAIGAMPDGIYEAESALDDDCIGNGPLPVKVRAIVDGDELTIDLEGSAGQNPGVVNCGFPATLSACRIALKSITNPGLPACEGDFAPMTVRVPEDSMFNARYPAPTFMYGTHLILLIDTVCRALAQAIPGRVLAGHYGNLSGFMLVGHDPASGELYIQQEPENGGWGASESQDGENAMIFVADGDTRNIAAEVLESRFPLRLERHELRTDSGGPGRNRGGLGILREYRILGHTAHLTAIMDRKVCPPWGLDGGGPAWHCKTVVDPGTADEHVWQKAMRVPVADGSLVSVQTGGGGGWGDPLQRPPERVIDDVIAGYVSREAAERDYRVVLDGALALDLEATTSLRAAQSGGR
ncbi:MAG: hydantoinase B/oxoprolinase family protein [Gaiellales bacterium]